MYSNVFRSNFFIGNSSLFGFLYTKQYFFTEFFAPNVNVFSLFLPELRNGNGLHWMFLLSFTISLQITLRQQCSICGSLVQIWIKNKQLITKLIIYLNWTCVQMIIIECFCSQTSRFWSILHNDHVYFTNFRERNNAITKIYSRIKQENVYMLFNRFKWSDWKHNKTGFQ